jgi:predicted amidohydrolase YtcJ
VRTAHDAGWSVAVHAIGDRAIDAVLDAFAALPAGSTQDRGHRMEHVEMARPSDRERMRSLGIRPCVQPNFLQWAGPGGLYQRALGPERLARMNPFRSFLDEECHPFFGSDGMPTSPVLGLRLAVNHPVESQRLSGDEALRLYTEAAADGVPGHPVSGRIEPGEVADLAVFSTDPETMPDPGLADLTVLDGRIVHRSEALERAGRT